MIIVLIFWLLSGALFVCLVFVSCANISSAFDHCLEAASKRKIADASSENGQQCMLFFSSFKYRSTGMMILRHVTVTYHFLLELISIIASLFFLVSDKSKKE